MYAFIFLGLLAFASSAPQYIGLSPYVSDELETLGSLERALDEEIFSMRKFWLELARDMRRLEQSLLELPGIIPKEKIEGNMYRIEMSLPGYKESDITVKTGRGVIKITALKELAYGGSNGVMLTKTLPPNVSEDGNWSYENDVLTIELPLKDTITVKDDEPAKPEPEHSREEIEKDNTDDNMDADVGAETTVFPDILTNEIPQSKVEATTYTENLGNEIEFVPARY